MIRRSACLAFASVSTLLLWASSALAGDPSKIGDKLENVVSPNVESFWKIGMIIGVLGIIFGRLKTSVIVSIFACIVVSGIVIFNPGGVSDTIQTLSHKVL